MSPRWNLQPTLVFFRCNSPLFCIIFPTHDGNSRTKTKFGFAAGFFESLPCWIWRPSGAWYEVTTAVSSPCSAASKLLEAKCDMTIAPVDSGICLRRFSQWEFHDPKVEVIYHIKVRKTVPLLSEPEFGVGGVTSTDKNGSKNVNITPAHKNFSKICLYCDVWCYIRYIYMYIYIYKSLGLRDAPSSNNY